MKAKISVVVFASMLMLAGIFFESRPALADRGDSQAITAGEVVDRGTLKDFVIAGMHYFVERVKSDGIEHAKESLRDGTAWKAGSVYLFILKEDGEVVFHGFNQSLEGQNPINTLVDAETEELVIPPIINAATGNTEGGFVQYHFDDPSDDFGNAKIPKVSYARVHDGIGGISQRLIFGSGIYVGAPSVIAARQNLAVKSALPQVMRAMTASTVDAVSGRIRQATSGTPLAKGFSLGGASTFSDALQANGRALGNGTFDLGRLLAGSSFTLPLNAAATGSGPFGNLVVWGSGDYRNFSGGNLNTVDYDGDVVSANLGVDTRLSEDLLAGLSVSWSRGQVEYMDVNEVIGESETTLTSVNPYVGWQSPGGMDLWAAAGYGWGEVDINERLVHPDGDIHRFGDTAPRDLTQQMVAAGVSGPLVASDRVIEGGTTSLRLKGETAFTWADIDGTGTIESVTLNASRHRLMFEGSHAHRFASGVGLTSSVEFGLRYDGGDGETGNSIETGAGLRYTNPASGLTIEGRARTLLAHESDYEEWGVSGLVRLDPGAAGMGLSLSVQPAWGQTAAGVQQLWANGVSGLAPTNNQVGRVNARIAYGFGTTWGGQGVLTPYTDVSLSGEGSRRVSLGGLFTIGPSITMSLEGAHSQPARGLTNHGVMLRGDLNW